MSELTSKERLTDSALAGAVGDLEARVAVAKLNRIFSTMLDHNDAREFLMGLNELRSIRAAHEPCARQCNHGALSPKGTMFYHGFVGAANQWRCDVCRGFYEGNLTEPNKQGSQLLTLVSSAHPITCAGCDGTGGPSRNCAGCGGTGRAAQPPGADALEAIRKLRHFAACASAGTLVPIERAAREVLAMTQQYEEKS